MLIWFVQELLTFGLRMLSGFVSTHYTHDGGDLLDKWIGESKTLQLFNWIFNTDYHIPRHFRQAEDWQKILRKVVLKDNSNKRQLALTDNSQYTHRRGTTFFELAKRVLSFCELFFLARCNYWLRVIYENLTNFFVFCFYSLNPTRLSSDKKCRGDRKFKTNEKLNFSDFNPAKYKQRCYWTFWLPLKIKFHPFL